LETVVKVDLKKTYLEKIVDLWVKRPALLNGRTNMPIRPITVYLGDHTALTQLHTGHKIYVDTRDVGIASHLMMEGKWEPWIERVIMRELRAGMAVADVGANFGYYTLLSAAAVGPTGKVFSIEANPHLVRLLRQSVSVNGFSNWVEVFPIAISDRVSEAYLTFDYAYSGGGQVSYENAPSETYTQFPVETAPLDQIIASNVKVDFMKIDIEGAEVLAIRGAKRILDAPGNLSIVMEFYRPAIERFEPAFDFIEGFRRRGFSLSRIEYDGVSLLKSSPDVLDAMGNELGYILLKR
jgi:FkbM family methyltransferase